MIRGSNWIVYTLKSLEELVHSYHDHTYKKEVQQFVNFLKQMLLIDLNKCSTNEALKHPFYTTQSCRLITVQILIKLWMRSNCSRNQRTVWKLPADLQLCVQEPLKSNIYLFSWMELKKKKNSITKSV